MLRHAYPLRRQPFRGDAVSVPVPSTAVEHCTQPRDDGAEMLCRMRMLGRMNCAQPTAWSLRHNRNCRDCRRAESAVVADSLTWFGKFN